MKDGAMKACVGMVMGAQVYSVYMLSNAMVGVTPPDGNLLLGMLVFVGSMAGVSIALPKVVKESAQEAQKQA